LFAAASHGHGASLYRQMCAKCHGRDGQGVKGKYDDALRGDRSLEKLARYINRSMPDDDPGKCTKDQAAAVAAYIYDAFYSREARFRNNPQRVELVRLTNKQYVNTVADIFKHFTGNDGMIPKERGLHATYYATENFDGAKKAFARVDRAVDFDFGTGRPDQEHFPSNNFSIQWEGSLLSDESGEYEFLLKTPNGVRLWINDMDEPIIDAWVSSGQTTDHRAKIHLIGGRPYPLRLNFFRFQDKTAAISLYWKPPHGAEEVISARSLIPSGSSPTFVVTTPFPADDSSMGYERGVAISKAWDEATTQAAIESANYAVANLDRLSGSKPQDTNRVAKAEAFCAAFVAEAFRRPLAEDQKRLFVEDQFKKAKKLEDAVKRVVLLALKSPQFLYLGLQREKPDDFEIATRLSFGMWDSLPDDELQKLAGQGQLHTHEQVAGQASRMLNDARAHAKMQTFLHHWLQMDRVESLSKDDKLFPGFTPETIADLRTSLDIFLADTFWSDTSDYRKLLLADYLFVNQRLAQFYGLSTNTSDDFVKVTLDANERSGVLTHPYLLAAFSYQKQTSPIHRGVFLTRNIVGRALRPPPMAQTFNDATFATNLTMREKVAQLTRSQTCQACHSVINPLGFSLEKFDAVGRFRTRDNDQLIDASAEYTTDDGETISLKGARDLAQFAVSNEQAQNGFIEQLFKQVAKQPMLAYGSDVPNMLRESFVASNFNMQELLTEIATTTALHGLEQPTRKKS